MLSIFSPMRRISFCISVAPSKEGGGGGSERSGGGLGKLWPNKSTSLDLVSWVGAGFLSLTNGASSSTGAFCAGMGSQARCQHHDRSWLASRCSIWPFVTHSGRRLRSVQRKERTPSVCLSPRTSVESVERTCRTPYRSTQRPSRASRGVVCFRSVVSSNCSNLSMRVDPINKLAHCR